MTLLLMLTTSFHICEVTWSMLGNGLQVWYYSEAGCTSPVQSSILGYYADTCYCSNSDTCFTFSPTSDGLIENVYQDATDCSGDSTAVPLYNGVCRDCDDDDCSIVVHEDDANSIKYLNQVLLFTQTDWTAKARTLVILRLFEWRCHRWRGRWRSFSL